MIRSQRQVTDLASWAAIVSGTVYGVYAYFLQREGPWGPEPYPAQSAWQYAHIMLVPGLVFVFGQLWRSHILVHYRGIRKDRRYSGILLVATLFAMILSGYALQVTIEESLQTIWVACHTTSSALFTLLFIVHRLFRFL